MIYLLSQMIIALIVAAILGAAVGWLIHRASHEKDLHKLKKALGKHKAKLSQAQSEVAMLSDDYNELKHQSQDQLDALRSENQQIPSLQSNLEKSQLLVRQMMQRHETSTRELTNERNSLLKKLSLSDRQQEHSKSAKNYSESSLYTRQNAARGDMVLENIEVIKDGSTATEDASGASVDNETGSSELPYDTVIEIADDLQRELKQELNPEITNTETELILNSESAYQPPAPTQTRDNERQQVHSPAKLPELVPDESKVQDLEQTQKQDQFMTGRQTDGIGRAPTPDLRSSKIIGDENTHPSPNVSLNRTQRNEKPALDIFLDKTAAGADETLDPSRLVGGQDTSILFSPVDKHDDLQQIFGIGPLTEKALNDLGITSYSQLAELNEHEIQKIADALDIGSARIERDNWVGNARRQLEDVLEQL